MDLVETTISAILSSGGFAQETTVNAGLYESRKTPSEDKGTLVLAIIATGLLLAQIMGSSPLPVRILLKLL